MSASYKKTCVLSTSAAAFATETSSLRAKFSRTLTEGPPFMWDNNSNAKFGVISSIDTFSSIISSKKLAFSLAASVVPGKVL